MHRRLIYILWGVLAVTVLSTATCFYAIWKGWIGYVPDIQELDNPIDKFASQVYSSEGKMIGTWARSENRVFVSEDEISPYVFKALIATEDVRFYEHSGIDLRALMRAIIKRGMMGKTSAGGGSTITQQLAKQLYSSTASSYTKRIVQKPIEWVIAVMLERNYTKDEIITLYLNYFDFLHNAVGIKTAAETYFSKKPKDLNITESALLIGMCKNPSYFNPVREPERCKDRRNVVLAQMLKAEYITQKEYDENRVKPLDLKFHRIDHKDGIATYFREYLRKILMAKKPNRANYQVWQKQNYYDDSLSWENDPIYGWCNKHTKQDGSYYNIYTDGLKIYSTINARMQRYAEEAVTKHVENYLQPIFEKEKRRSKTAPFTNSITPKQAKAILMQSVKQSDRYRSMKADGHSEEDIMKAFNERVHMTVYTHQGEVDTIMTPMDSIKYYKSFLRTGFMVIDPTNGAVKAYVGGLNYAHFQYDMCTEGRRQIGSTIKPFLYALAMENGYEPCDMVKNIQRTYTVGDKEWTPRNGSKARYGEMVSLKWGLSRSNNWVSAYLMSQLSPSALVELIHNLGVTNQSISPTLSLCLGPCEISISELVSAYTAFVNKGIRVAPLFVTRIEDNEGNVIEDFQPKMNEVISERSALRMLEMLQSVIDGGTGVRLRFKYKIEAPMAGKTGTTNNNSDGWFVGITPRLVGACWVGGENRDIHFDTMLHGQGASTSLPVWAYFIKKIYNDISLGYSDKEEFDYPEDYTSCGNYDIDSLSVVNQPNANETVK